MKRERVTIKDSSGKVTFLKKDKSKTIILHKQIKQLQKEKEEIYKNIENYIKNELYNHRKEKEGLISLQNMLLNDILGELQKLKNK